MRSVVEVIGYRVHAVDGEIGHIENLLFDGADWSVRYFIVDTRNGVWKACVDFAARCSGFDWFDRHVALNVSRELVKASRPWYSLVAFNDEYAKAASQTL